LFSFERVAPRWQVVVGRVRTFALPALFAAVTKGGEIVAAGAVGERGMGSGVSVTLDDRINVESDGKASPGLDPRRGRS